ncbi:MAG: lipase family protein [Okeania sp. SIO2D1]|nr:lipase family protein [Okeania sp. SIO2D1]
MEICEILGLSLSTYGTNEEEIIESANSFGVNISNVKQFSAGKKEIDSCYVADGENGKSVILAFRGTSVGDGEGQALVDWINNFMAKPVSEPEIPGKLHQGFSDSVRRLWNAGFYDEVETRLTGDKQLYITGYSKGGALAPIAAAFLNKKAGIKASKMNVWFFEPPRCGDTEFQNYFNQTFKTALRYEYQDDIVPHLPPAGESAKILSTIPIIGEILEEYLDLEEWDYKAVGSLMFINWEDEILEDLPAYLQWAYRLVHLIETINDGNWTKLFSDHIPNECCYPVICGKPYPTSVKIDLGLKFSSFMSTEDETRFDN